MTRPLIIDVEASGLGRGSYPIEIGVVLADGSTHELLVKPQKGWSHWNPEAEALHGISRELLHDEGLSVQDVAQQLNTWIEGETVFCDAWANDSSWLGLLFYEANIVQRFKLQTLRSIISEQQLPFWEQTKAAVFIDLGLKRHRAADDCRALQEAYVRTRLLAGQNIEEQGDV